MIEESPMSSQQFSITVNITRMHSSRMITARSSSRVYGGSPPGTPWDHIPRDQAPPHDQAPTLRSSHPPGNRPPQYQAPPGTKPPRTRHPPPGPGTPAEEQPPPLGPDPLVTRHPPGTRPPPPWTDTHL